MFKQTGFYCTLFGKTSRMDKLFASNIEDKEIFFKAAQDTEQVRDIPPVAILGQKADAPSNVSDGKEI